MEHIIKLKAKYAPVTHYPPDCCAACEYLRDDGTCQHFGEVPAEYLEQENDCPKFLPRIPF